MKFPLLLVSLLAVVSGGYAREWHVSPSGDDRNAGTQAAPLRTLDGARDGVRAWRKAQPANAKESVTVWIHAGVYPLGKTFELLREDGGTADAPVVWSRYQNEVVRLTGGLDVPADKFESVGDQTVLQRLPAEAREKVRVVDLRALGVTDFGHHRQFGHGQPVVPAPLELFWNEAPLPLARYPNRGAIPMGEVVDPGSVPRVADYSNRPGRFKYTDPRHERWVGVPDVWFQGYFNHGFADDKIRVETIDTAKGEVTLASPHMYGLGSGQNYNQYVALNLLEELDEPGEWYVDAQNGRLYLWAPGDLKQARIAVSVLETVLVALDNVSHLTLRGLVIENGRALGVSVEGGEYNKLVDCTVRNVGTAGILFGQGARQTFPGLTADDYTGEPVSRELGSFQSHIYLDTVWERNAGSHHSVVGCEIYNTGSGGIYLGGGSKKRLEPGDNAVTDSRIHDFNRRNRMGAAGVSVDGCGNRVLHCEIFNADSHALYARGNEHRFEFNHVHHVALDSNDTSAWYLGRDPSDQGNVVANNFFHDVGRPDRKWLMGVYCDDATAGVTVENNVFYKVGSFGSVYTNGGHDIVVRNNIFIQGYGPAYQLKSMWYDFGQDSIPYYFGPKGIYTKRLTKSVDIKASPYRERYPRLVDWLDLLPDGKTYVGMRPRGNVFDGNVLVKYEETFRMVGKYAQTEFGENYITQKDPGFVDMAKSNFQLRDDSVVYRELPNFKRIPFEKIGPRAAGERQ